MIIQYGKPLPEHYQILHAAVQLFSSPSPDCIDAHPSRPKSGQRLPQGWIMMVEVVWVCVSPGSNHSQKQPADVLMASSKTPRQADGIIMDYHRIFVICPSFRHNIPRRELKKESDKGRTLVDVVLVREVEVLDLVALVPVFVVLPHV